MVSTPQGRNEVNTMSNQKRKAVIDDGMNPELVEGASFDGIFQIPIIEAPKHILIPKGITPFTQIGYDPHLKKNAVGFYEMDTKFSNILINTDECIERIQPAGAMVTPPTVLYIEMLLFRFKLQMYIVIVP